MAATSTHPTILYIAGTSRSGSTLLDHLLGSHPQTHSVGEMRRLQGFARQDYALSGRPDRSRPHLCSCGKTIVTCPFWTRVQDQSGVDLQRNRFRHSTGKWSQRLLSRAWWWFGPQAARPLSQILPTQGIEAARNCFRVYDAIGQVSNVAYIVDSSKDILHFLYLFLAAPERVKLIHLVRDGRAVAYSASRGERAARWKGKEVSPFVQAVHYWRGVNQYILKMAERFPANQKILLRYEDLCATPQTTLDQIQTHFALGLAYTAFDIEPARHHTVGGSPTLKTSMIQLDTAWQSCLTADQLASFEQIGGDLNRRLGYS
jgi:hypothetical protein